MPKKLSQKEYCQKVYECVGDKYIVVSEYKNKRSPITLKCNIHNVEFTVTAECFMRGPEDVRGCCPECAKENNMAKYNRTEVECAYCGIKFMKKNSKLNNSKSGLHFCCREHKDLAQRLDSGEKFAKMRPEHYGQILSPNSNYRGYAIREYGAKCAVCGFDEDPSLLEVHHIDENRNNNNIENLIPLCPMCHRKLTTHKYKLINREKIIKIEE